MKNLNLNLFLFLVIGLLGLFIAWAITYLSLKNIEHQLLASLVQLKTLDQKNEGVFLDNFAQCLTKKGIKLYGSARDAYTQEQKAMFGKAVNYLTYIECVEPESKQLTFECQVEGIKNFPTWEFPNKEKKAGILFLGELGKLSDCRF